MEQIILTPNHLSSGDSKSAGVDLGMFQINRIRSIKDPLFETAYSHLWAQFGEQDEMELRETLDARFQLAPRILYEMILVRRNEEFIAVRDHTAIVTEGAAVVHLSHNLVAQKARRTGLAGWLRAWPISTARDCLTAQGLSPNAPITLIAEMEYASDEDPARTIRLDAYEKAGFLKVDPQSVSYHQPDFRSGEVIDATGGPRPLPFQLVLRRVARETDQKISGRELQQNVRSLYAIYGALFRPADMAHPLLSLDAYPAEDASIALVPPTQS